jgi:archaellum biogenesis ATPase FlaH
MSANKWMKQLRQAEGAVDQSYDALAPENIMKSPSPSLNWICGKAGGIPYGFSAVFYGPAKSGKSLASYLFAGQLHQENKEAIVVRFDTEMRSTAQMKGNWGIDYDRFVAIDTNKPSQIFDYISKDINEMCEQGAPIKMIIIDSLTAIQGLREQNADSIENIQMADRAAMVTKGLKQILPVIRKHLT